MRQWVRHWLGSHRCDTGRDCQSGAPTECRRCICTVRSQVVSAGLLGVLGRNGWYCRESDVDKWPALAGWRGLRDPAVRSHFNNTFFAFEPTGWGPNEAMMANFGLSYTMVFLGADSAVADIEGMLDSGQPALFFLWTPHAILANHELHRIDLPAFSPRLFAAARSDYPTDVLEKVQWRWLAQIAPLVHQLYSRFNVDNAAQDNIMGAAYAGGLSVKEATCAWFKSPENALAWRAWLPPEEPQCGPGQRLNKSLTPGVTGLFACSTCPAGFVSEGGTATVCTACKPGRCARS